MQPARDIARRLDALSASPRLRSWIGRLALGGFFEVYDVALTAVATPGLERAGVFHRGDAGMFGYADQATFAFVTLFGIFIGSAFFGRLADRFGRKHVFTAAMVWYAVTTVAMAGQSSAPLVCAWRLLAGVGLGVEMVTIDCYLTELAPRRLRGRIFSVAQFIQLLGVPAAHLLGFALAERAPLGIAGWRWLAVIPAIGALAVVVLRRGLPESPRWLAEHGHLPEAERALAVLEASAGKSAASRPNDLPDAATPSSEPSRLCHPPLRGRVLFLAAANTASSVAFYGFANWVPSLLHEKGVPIHDVFGYTAAVGLTYPATPLLCALLADRIERKWQIVVTSLSAAALGLALSQTHVGIVWVILGVLLAASNQARVTAEHVYRSEHFPTVVRARAVGLVYSVSRIGTAVSSYAVGACFVRGGGTAVFTLLGGSLVLCALVTGLAGPLTGARAHKEVPT